MKKEIVKSINNSKEKVIIFLVGLPRQLDTFFKSLLNNVITPNENEYEFYIEICTCYCENEYSNIKHNEYIHERKYNSQETLTTYLKKTFGNFLKNIYYMDGVFNKKGRDIVLLQRLKLLLEKNEKNNFDYYIMSRMDIEFLNPLYIKNYSNSFNILPRDGGKTPFYQKDWDLFWIGSNIEFKLWVYSFISTKKNIEDHTNEQRYKYIPLDIFKLLDNCYLDKIYSKNIIENCIQKHKIKGSMFNQNYTIDKNVYERNIKNDFDNFNMKLINTIIRMEECNYVFNIIQNNNCSIVRPLQKKKIMFLGSCQMTTVKMGLLKCKDFNNNYEVITFNNQVYSANDEEIDFILSMVPKIDILVTQPVSDEYYNKVSSIEKKGVLSTTNIISKLKKDAKIIIVPVLHFDGYVPQNIGIQLFTTDNYLNLIDINLLKLYYEERFTKKNNMNDEIIKKYNDIIKYKNFYEENYIIDRINKAIERLDKREKDLIKYKGDIHIIYVSKYIKYNYDKKLLFKIYNHPTKILYSYIFEEIFKILDLEFDDNVNLINPHTNEGNDFMLYDSVKNILSFEKENDIKKYCLRYIENFDKINKDEFEEKIKKWIL